MTTTAISLPWPAAASLETMRDYFSRETEAATDQIRRYEPVPPVGPEVLEGRKLLESRWGPCLWLRDLVCRVAAKFFAVIGCLLCCLGVSDLAKRCSVFSVHCNTSNLEIVAEVYGDNYLVPSFNTHRLDTEDLYLLPSLPRGEIPSSNIRNLLRPLPGEGILSAEKLRFGHFWGVCRGMSDWFSHLYARMERSSQDKEHLLCAIASLFKEGATRPASLLQSFPCGAPAFLPTDLTASYRLASVHPADDSSKSSLPSQDAGVSLFSLPEGVYKLWSKSHALVYIKTGPDLAYFWDPNFGLLRFRSRGRWRPEDNLRVCLSFYGGPYDLYRCAVAQEPRPVSDALPHLIELNENSTRLTWQQFTPFCS